MKESEWVACTDPTAMVRFVRFKLGVRKLRLFAAACHRREWDRLDEKARASVEEGERLADERPAIEALGLRAAKADADAARHAAGRAVKATDADRAAQAALLRCIFGNPFRPPPPLDPARVPWNYRTIVHLADAVYKERCLPRGTFHGDRLGVLADALEEVGAAAELVAHLRKPGHLHVRGCNVVDLLLGKS